MFRSHDISGKRSSPPPPRCEIPATCEDSRGGRVAPRSQSRVARLVESDESDSRGHQVGERMLGTRKNPPAVGHTESGRGRCRMGKIKGFLAVTYCPGKVDSPV